ncbi:MAG: hypothetical protein LBV75_05000 [Paludibacter sp.]|jgi:hypothetical protein|nr:hypothetical protein [Paludibacter sp.]
MPTPKYDKLFFGLLPSVLIPALFIWLYIGSSNPSDLSTIDLIISLCPSHTLGKLLMLSYIPDMLGMYIFYKLDLFRIASGFMIGGLPYFVASFFML